MKEVECVVKFKYIKAEIVEYGGVGHHLIQKNPNNKHCHNCEEKFVLDHHLLSN